MALIILAHPRYDSSLANKTIMEELQSSGQNHEIRNIHSLYPDYRIDVQAEHRLCSVIKPSCCNILFTG